MPQLMGKFEARQQSKVGDDFLVPKSHNFASKLEAQVTKQRDTCHLSCGKFEFVLLAMVLRTLELA